ncbi:helix-turn-helix domain-containing protein [Agromyces aerolatus]|uniref:helix-turn-helix domain-containing protein n=1 Tax=Agromyces sp. LY-1074 TaxID=3074080 RepID=UPI0028550E7F|nr:MULTISPECIES: helix-turn-helix domain-containing protein [unclassified Agromyces]MDR5698684.1 helix-turn-helix domain-containing protein [Agromyces sp. LY-1074]MDR5704978.1 helix-turn-helix domain-containing protein [Agromyces sp. LY-1358]
MGANMPDSLGERLRDARLKRGLSLRRVAQSLGVSASLISQVEIGKTQPSVATLYALANHLGASLDELLGLADESVAPAVGAVDGSGGLLAVQRADDNPVIEMENGVRWERLAAAAGGPADAILVTYEPGASSSVEGKLMRHAGIEYAYLLEGELTLHLDFDTYVLRPGDSLQFDSVRPHLYENRGSGIAKGVWFVVGRRQQNQAMRDAPGEPVKPGATIGSAVDVLRSLDELGA